MNKKTMVWPALRINFAYFGNLADEENSKWADTIIEMMEL